MHVHIQSHSAPTLSIFQENSTNTFNYIDQALSALNLYFKSHVPNIHQSDPEDLNPYRFYFFRNNFNFSNSCATNIHQWPNIHNGGKCTSCSIQRWSHNISFSTSMILFTFLIIIFRIINNISFLTSMILFFLDAIASPSSYPCQWVGG